MKGLLFSFFFCFVALKVSFAFQTEFSSITPTDSIRIEAMLGDAFKTASKSPAKAMMLCNEALVLSKRLNWPMGIAGSYSRKGVVYYYLASYDSALGQYYEALKIYERLGDVKRQGAILNNIGLVFQSKQEHEEARSYYKKALEFSHQLKDEGQVAGINMNLGIIYRQLGELDSAFIFYKSSKKVFEKVGNRRSLASVNNNIGMVFLTIEELDSAEAYYVKAYDLAKAQDNLSLVAQTLNNLGKVNAMRRNYDSALYLLQNAFLITDSLNLKMVKFEILENLKLLEIDQENYQQALAFQSQELELRKLIFDQEKEAQVARMKAIYAVAEANKQVVRSQESLEWQKRWNEVLIVSSVFLMAFVVALWRVFKIKTKANKVLKVLNEQIVDKNNEILTTSEALSLANQQISSINNSLEKKVEERTQKLKDQNNKLIDYAHFNAHEVRGPVARLSGLLLLIEDHPGSVSDEEFRKRASEDIAALQDRVNKISKVLNSEDWSIER